MQIRCHRVFLGAHSYAVIAVAFTATEQPDHGSE